MDRSNRSHPTLSPLTTLPTSPSPSYIYPTTSIPSTPSLLSRPTSLTRLRPRALPPSKSTSALNKSSTKTNHSVRRSNDGDNEDWITRTASTLTLTRLEERGQSWLAARYSSTSLTGGEVGDYDFEPGYRSLEWERESVRRRGGEGDRLRSRGGSVGRERFGRDGVDAGGDEGGEDLMGPDFVDGDERDGGEDVDEGEMRKVVMGRVGGWVDWAVGWMDMRGEEDAEDAGYDGDEEHGGEGEGVLGGELDSVELQKRLRRKTKRDKELEVGTSGVGKPPEGEQAGVWTDAKWLLGMARKVAL